MVVGALLGPLAGTAWAQDSVSVTPETKSTAVNTCSAYTVTVIDDGAPGAGLEVDGWINMSDADTLQDLEVSFCDPADVTPPPTAVAPSDLDDNAVVNTGDGMTDFATEPAVPTAGLENPAQAETEPIGADGSIGTTNADGQLTFGVVADEAGTMNIRVSAEVDGLTINDTAVQTWVVPTVAAVDCSPETDSNREGTPHTFTCTALSAATGGVPVPGATLWADVTAGPNAEEVSPFSSVADGTGTATFTYTDSVSPASLPGTDTIVGYFNLPCPRAGVTTCSNAPEADEPQDEILKTFSGPPRIIDCEPETAENTAGTTHVVTCTVTDRAAQPVSNVEVTFTETGPGRFATGGQSFIDATDSSGVATADLASTAEEEGDQTVTGEITDEDAGTPVVTPAECLRAAEDPPAAPAGVCTDDVVKTWVAPQVIRVPSTVGIRHKLRPHVFRGRVNSERARCERRRVVRIKKVGVGTVGTDRTNRAGRYVERHRRGGRGRYFAVVARKSFVSGAGDLIICQKARSRRIRARR
jgi:hypothetical protein